MRIQDEERNELWFLEVSAGKYGWKMEGKRDGPMGENRQNRNVRGGARKMRPLETMMMKNKKGSLQSAEKKWMKKKETFPLKPILILLSLFITETEKGI